MLRQEYLIYRLQQTATGRSVLELFEQYADEVEAMFRNYREIAVAWNRHHGPRFIAEGLKGAADQDLNFVSEIEGVMIGTLIRKMASVFLNHASPGLSRAIEENVPVLLTWTSKYSGINEVFEHLNKEDHLNRGIKNQS